MFIELGLPEDTKLCLFIYGGQPPGQWELKADALPEGWICVVCSGGKPILSDKQLPSNFRLASPDEFIPDLVRPELCLRCLATFAAQHASARTSMAADRANSFHHYQRVALIAVRAQAALCCGLLLAVCTILLQTCMHHGFTLSRVMLTNFLVASSVDAA